MAIVLNTNPKITVDLPNGIYLLDSMSSTGKTYMCTILQSVASKYRDVLVYNYRDYINSGMYPLSFVGKYKLIVADRFDMYADDAEVLNLLLKHSDSAVVLLDKKSIYDIPLKAKYAFLDLEEDSIWIDN